MNNYKIDVTGENKIFLVKDSYGNKFYQKQYSLDSIKSNHLWEVLNRLKNINNPHIVKIYEVSKDNQYIQVKEEACLQTLRIQVENNKLDNSQILKCMLDIIEGLIQLKNLKMMHRDIKPDNIVYDGENFKIIDFETAKIINNDNIKFQSLDVGTNGYRAPQIIFEKQYSSKCDIWSLGCVLYFMLFKKEIFCEQKIENEQYFQDIMNNISKNNSIPQDFISLLLSMLQIDEDKRIDLKQLKDKVMGLYQNNYNTSTVSTQIENTTQQSIQIENYQQVICQNNEDLSNFNQIMRALIQNKMNAQKKINLYLFWVKRLESQYPDELEIRKSVETSQLTLIKQLKEQKIKFNLFLEKEDIKQSLLNIQELQTYYDF
ncbi:unnamed protein product [Paramecium sonneborni]|uniref:Protein kinase domain-containing protein n=1 Tax=Paramecium sonneborni TaxID=65129 RepID=A0A8S1JX98_9CILI|nr:unnamed protein product [Paramecium sonneborni]